jgi:peptidoglycan/LPS O-acetylase OafA/YrhL
MTSTSVKQKRLLELDILRALAIIMIVIGHTAYYVTTPPLPAALYFLQFYLFFFGLSMFFFVSGFVLYYSHDSIETTKGMLDFWKKRVVRIFPLYWLSIIALLVLQTFNIKEHLISFSFSSVLIQMLGLQALLAPRFISPIFININWFVSVILIFYLIYPLIVRPFRDGRDGAHLVLASFAVLLPFVVMRLLFDIIDFRFFLYYGIFVAGILTCKYGAMYKSSPQPRFLCIGAILLIAILFLMRFLPLMRYAKQAETAAAVGFLFNGFFPYNPADVPSLISVVILLNIVALLFIYVAFIAARLYVPSINRAMLSLILIIAFSSYSIYLFHRLIFASLDALAHAFQLGMVQTDVVIILLGYPLVLGVSYFIQRQEKNMVIRIGNIRKRGRKKIKDKSPDL